MSDFSLKWWLLHRFDFYRRFQKWAHRRGWHHMQERPTMCPGTRQFVCHWCGMTGGMRVAQPGDKNVIQIR